MDIKVAIYQRVKETDGWHERYVPLPPRLKRSKGGYTLFSKDDREGAFLISSYKNSGGSGTSFPALVKYTSKDFDYPMADWKVIALVSGNIEAVSGPAAQNRPTTHEWIVWEGQAANKAEALKCAEKADPRVDLEWMRIRFERDPGPRKK